MQNKTAFYDLNFRFFQALIDSGDAFRQMADVKYQLEDNVKHNFLDPISDFQNNELKDFNVSFFLKFLLGHCFIHYWLKKRGVLITTSKKKILTARKNFLALNVLETNYKFFTGADDPSEGGGPPDNIFLQF